MVYGLLFSRRVGACPMPGSDTTVKVSAGVAGGLRGRAAEKLSRERQREELRGKIQLSFAKRYWHHDVLPSAMESSCCSWSGLVLL